MRKKRYMVVLLLIVLFMAAGLVLFKNFGVDSLTGAVVSVLPSLNDGINDTTDNQTTTEETQIIELPKEEQQKETAAEDVTAEKSTVENENPPQQETSSVEIQDINTKATIDTSACGTLNEAGATYSLIQSVSSAATCFTIAANNVELDCNGYQIIYSDGEANTGVGVNNTGGYDNIIIRECVIIDSGTGTTSERYGIHFVSADGGTIVSNTINTSHKLSHGIVLVHSSNNYFFMNNISVKYSANLLDTREISYPILINETTAGGFYSTRNTFVNTNISANISRYSIADLKGSGSSSINTIIYNNSQGQINWTLTNITTNINLSYFGVGATVFLDNGVVGLANIPRIPQQDAGGNPGPGGINTTARIEFRNLTFQNAPDVLKAGRRCDNESGSDKGFACNISYWPSLGILYANITSFSNYTLQDNDPPNVTIIFPLNNAVFGFGFMIGFNATISDVHTSVSNVTFQFTNKSFPFNRTAEKKVVVGNPDRWNVTLNASQFGEGTHGFRVWANDSLHNINNTEFVNFTIDLTAPLVTITSPPNGSNLSTGMINFNVTPLDDITNVSGVIFQFSNATPFNVSAVNRSGNWGVSVNVTNLTEGRIAIVVYANDTVNNMNNTENITINVDRTSPIVNMFTTPVLTSDVTPSFQFNFSDFSLSANCSLYFNATFNATDGAVANRTNTNLTAATELFGGNYVTSINCTDASGNIGGNSFAITINSTNVTDCRDLKEQGAAYVLSNFVQKDGTCFTVLANDITLDCRNYNITYGNGINFYAVDDTGGYDNITIRNCPMYAVNCPFCDPQSGPHPAIFFQGVDISSVTNNIIRTVDLSSHGIILSGSSNNTISSNNISATGSGIFINGTSRTNTLINNTIGSTQSSLIVINDISSGSNYLLYNNSFGSMLWNRTNLTTNVTLKIGTSIFLENNLVGLLNIPGLENLNRTAQIQIKNLNFFNTPWLLKAGVRCDNTILCNVSYDSITGTLTANVSSFSNYSTRDGTAPNVTITTPTNGTNFSIRSPLQNFNATVLDDTNVSWVIFQFANGTTPFNRTAGNSSGTWNVSSFNTSTLVEGTHLVTVFANDTLNNINNTQSVTITVDFTAPNVSITAPATGRNFSFRSPLQDFNATVWDNTTLVDTVIFYFSNITNSFNRTATNVSGTWRVAAFNLSSLAEGTHTIKVFANDTVGNMNDTQTISITVDLTAPNLSITAPATGRNFSFSSSLQDFNATVWDNTTLVNNVIFYFSNITNSFNRTAANVSGTWRVAAFNLSSLAEGTHTIKVFANDTVGNMNDTQTISITVDLTAPNVTITAPQNGSNFSANSALQSFNALVLDNTTQVNTVIFYFSNNSNPFNRTAVNNSGTWGVSSFNMSSLAEGHHTVKVFANDTVNNVNDTKTINITVDKTAPLINITHPSSGTFSGLGYFNATVRDELLQVNTVLFQFDNGAQNFTATNSSGLWGVTVDTGLLSEGGQVVTVYANDSVNNVNNTIFLRITIDNLPETVIGGTSPVTAPPSEITRELPAIEVPTETPAEAAPAETATAGEVSRAFHSGNFKVSASSNLSLKPGEVSALTAKEKIASPLNEVETRTIVITNQLGKMVVLSAALREPDIALKDEENIKKRIGEGLTNAPDSVAKDELAAIRLLERVEVLQVYKTKLSNIFPRALTGAAVAPLLRPTHNQVSARLLRDSLVNADEFQDVKIAPGETITKEVKVRRGLSLDKTQAAELVFSAGGEEVFTRDLGSREELTAGTAIDLNPEKKTLDFYVLVPPKNGGGKEVFAVEFEINAEKPIIKSSRLPIKVMLPFLFAERSKTVYSELYGPYTVNLERGALLAVQYDASALAGKYNAIGRVYLGGSQLIAENHYQIES